MLTKKGKTSLKPRRKLVVLNDKLQRIKDDLNDPEYINKAIGFLADLILTQFFNREIRQDNFVDKIE